MVKRTLIAIAVLVFVTSAVHAAGPDPHFFEKDKDISIKVNNEKIEIGWPYDYKALTICTMPIYMNVGYYVQIEDCSDRKIKLQQKDCTDVSIGKGSGDFPCYFDCEDFKIRANFDVKLGFDITNKSSVIDGIDAYYDGGSVVTGDGSWHTMTICVKAWKAKLLEHSPGSEIKVADLKITVKPNV